MTAQSMAVACSLAVLAMGAMDPAAAFDDRQTAAFDRPVATGGGVTDPAAIFTDIGVDQHDDVIALDHLDPMSSGFGRRQEGDEQPPSPFKAYAGIGVSKLKLSMDFDSGDVALKKDKGYSRPRLIFGMGYKITEDFSLGLEYRALAADEPLFSLDMGSETVNVDTRFTRHNVFLKAKYKF